VFDPLGPTRIKVLERVAHGDPPSEILVDICRNFEEILPGTIAGVTILDRSAQVFQQAVFPSLSDEYGKALEGIEVADKPGTCALAIFEGRTIECSDVHADDRFSPRWKELSLQHGMKALISIPTLARDGVALGTFVVAYSPDAPLSPDDRGLADDTARLCGVVLMYRRHQMKHELLVGELQHRVRNLFSTIGAVVYATLKSHPEPGMFRKTFDARLMALSRAHALAVEPGETDLRQLLTDTLAPYSVEHDISLDGPMFLLTPDAAVAFSLSAHELATNAAKYGALSAEGGSVRVNWGFEGEADGGFLLTWHESGGPPVSPPRRQGYGQKTLHRSIASAVDGKVSLDYRPEGLVCSVTAPHSPRLGARTN
jgi:two-component sensor histidine kinase